MSKANLSTKQVVTGIALLVAVISAVVFFLFGAPKASAGDAVVAESANAIHVDAESMQRAQDWWANVEGVNCTHAFGAYWACKYPADTVEDPAAEATEEAELVPANQPIPVK